MAIINLVIIAKFFYIIYKALFISLLATNEVKKKLLELISNSFMTIEVYRHRITNLNYFI